VTGRFINADIYFDTGTFTPLSTNMFSYCENKYLLCNDRDGRTWYYWSWRRIRDKYQASVTLFYWSYSPIFYFTVSTKGLVTFPFATKNGSSYYNNSNFYNFVWLLSIGDTYALAHAINTVAKSINGGNLSWRSVNGLNIELVVHYIAFVFEINRSSSYAAEMGSRYWWSRGYDSNAWVFEEFGCLSSLLYGSSYVRYLTVRSLTWWI